MLHKERCTPGDSQQGFSPELMLLYLRVQLRCRSGEAFRGIPSRRAASAVRSWKRKSTRVNLGLLRHILEHLVLGKGTWLLKLLLFMESLGDSTLSGFLGKGQGTYEPMEDTFKMSRWIGKRRESNRQCPQEI